MDYGHVGKKKSTKVMGSSWCQLIDSDSSLVITHLLSQRLIH